MRAQDRRVSEAGYLPPPGFPDGSLSLSAPPSKHGQCQLPSISWRPCSDWPLSFQLLTTLPAFPSWMWPVDPGPYS